MGWERTSLPLDKARAFAESCLHVFQLLYQACAWNWLAFSTCPSPPLMDLISHLILTAL